MNKVHNIPIQIELFNLNCRNKHFNTKKLPPEESKTQTYNSKEKHDCFKAPVNRFRFIKSKPSYPTLSYLMSKHLTASA